MINFFKNFFPIFSLRAVWGSLPVLAVLVPPALSAGLPETIERSLYVGFGHYAIFAPYLISFFCIPICFLQGGFVNKPLVAFGLFFLLSGIASAAYGEIPSSGLVYGSIIAMVFLLGSKVQWSSNDFRFVSLIATAVTVWLSSQAVVFSLGLVSIQVDSGFGDLGIEGEVSRVSTTVGAATGSAVMIMFFATLAFYTTLRSTRSKVVAFAILAFGIVAVSLTFSRGGILVAASFIFMIIFARNEIAKVSLPARLGFIFLVLAVAITGIVAKPEIIEKITKRGAGDYAETSFFADNGRFMRYQDAIAAWQEAPVLGYGLGSYYYRKSWLQSFPGRAVGLTSPHNVYLLFLAELGIVAFVLFVALLSIPLVLSFRRGNFVIFSFLIATYAVGMNVELIYFENITLNLLVLVFSLAMLHGATPRRERSAQLNNFSR